MNYLNLIVDEARIVELHIEAALSVRVTINRNTGVTPGLSDHQNLLLRSMAAILTKAESNGADQALAADFINMADELKESVSNKAEYLEQASREILPWENPAHYAVNAIQNVLRKIDKATGSSMIMGLIKLGLALAMVWAVKEEGKGTGEFLAAVAGMVFVMVTVMARVKGKDLSIASFIVGAAIAYGAVYFTTHGSTENALGICAVGGVFAMLYILIASAQKVDPGMGHSSTTANRNVMGGPEETFLMTNPATGLPMMGDVDIEGNAYGTGMDR
ncbi:hypothetical protein [Pseudomonas frederiksbergensis]|nr:hypothetical protein [Pseudomonas frederiksbergensis]